VFSLAYVTFGFVLNASRALTTDPLMIRYSQTYLPLWRRVVASSAGTAVAVGLVAGASMAASAVLLEGTAKTAFLALGLTMPGLMLHDSFRYAFFALGRGSQTFLNDVIWALVMLFAFLALRVTGHDIVFWFVLAWGLAATMAAGVGALQARVVPRLLNARTWVTRHYDLGLRYLAEGTATSGSTLLRVALLGGISGLAAVGFVQAAYVLMGPFLAILTGFSYIAIPEAARILRQSPRHLPLFCLLTAAALAVLALAWGAVLLIALPRGLGHVILGSLWRPVYPLVLPLTLSVVGTSLALGATAGLHALGSARRTLRAAVVISVAIVIASMVGSLIGGAVGSVRGMAVASGLTVVVSWWQLRAALRERRSASAGPTQGRSNTRRSQANANPKTESLAEAFVALVAILLEEQPRSTTDAPVGRWSSRFLF